MGPLQLFQCPTKGEDKTWPGSMDPPFGPGPRTTYMEWAHGPPVMDWVHAPLKKIIEGETNNKHDANTCKQHPTTL